MLVKIKTGNLWYRKGEQYNVSFATRKDMPYMFRTFEISSRAGNYYVFFSSIRKPIAISDAEIVGIYFQGRKNPHPGPEHKFQEAVMTYIKVSGLYGIHIPNEAKRSIVAGANMKKQGLTPGFPDVLIFDRFGNHSGLAIELKCKTNKPSQQQIEAMQELHERGWLCAVCWNLDEVVRLVGAYRNMLFRR